ncbi:LysR substrate-binding domain-containing protein [Streptomyces sp. NBC_00496]|uniref:LysR substrate-binding domain-containing protein n=1 Tax=unclassified Streptomyces TaxID=2593676 RepID=UPI003FA792B1
MAAGPGGRGHAGGVPGLPGAAGRGHGRRRGLRVGELRPEGTHPDAALRHGFRPRIAHVVVEWIAELGYVAAGLGVTLVPALAAESVRPDIVLLPGADEAAPGRAVYAATAGGVAPSPAARAFLGALREAAARIPAARGAAT